MSKIPRLRKSYETAKRYAELHLRTSGPCSFRSLQEWFLAQIPGITNEGDALNLTVLFTYHAVVTGLVRIDEDGSLVWTYLECHDMQELP